MTSRPSLVAVLCLAGAVLAHGGAAAQAPPPRTTGPATRQYTISSLDGGDLFRFYCASCHGREGTGHGPTAAALIVAPPDLTTLAARHGGTFPRDSVTRFVTSGDTPASSAHGSKEMPVWGPVFQGLDSRDTLNKARIDNLVSFLESIQREPTRR